MGYGCRECDGSIACRGCNYFEDKPLLEDDFGDPIYEGDEYYDIGGEIVCEDNLNQWAEKFLKRCSSDDI